MYRGLGAKGLVGIVSAEHKHKRNQAQAQKALALTVGLGSLAFAAAAAVYTYTKRLRHRAGYSKEHWTEAINANGSIRAFDQVAAHIAQQGCDPAIRAEVWPFLLGLFDPESTPEQRQQHLKHKAEEYQELLLRCQALEAALKESLVNAPAAAAANNTSSSTRPSTPSRPSPPTATSSSTPSSPTRAAAAAQLLPEQVVQFAEAHRIIVIDAVRTDFRKHAIAPIDGSSYGNVQLPDQTSVSHWLHGWLGAQSSNGSSSQPKLWISEATQQVLDNSPHLSNDSKRQAVRLIALLSAYAVHDPETGYCQGMSELALPFLVLFHDDSAAFWAFEALMTTYGVRRNFAVDESGIFGQLRQLSAVLGSADRVLMHQLRALGAAECHFAYRMIVVMMRRDLPISQVMRLWEMLWADAWVCQHQQHMSSFPGMTDKQPAVSTSGLTEQHDDISSPNTPGSAPTPPESTDLFIYFIAAVVISQRRRVLDECHDPDDVLRLFYTIKGIEFWECTQKAHQLRSAQARRPQVSLH
eukprot:jgi/Chrzof1/11071/Cz05g22120.t1